MPTRTLDQHRHPAADRNGSTNAKRGEASSHKQMSLVMKKAAAQNVMLVHGCSMWVYSTSSRDSTALKTSEAFQYYEETLLLERMIRWLHRNSTHN